MLMADIVDKNVVTILGSADVGFFLQDNYPFTLSALHF